ncbi:NADH-quinone oxidoreductase subunit M [Flavobacterium sp. GSP27]|uniref:NADH-quinone oxidoreductase subunit M n=1 Tax=Flavobacterium bomense TaxID=2497483 RepID=A0A432CQQ4_9FLAO|nr:MULTISPECIES: NADH-quinone oxidoreductase subunit M [Flavobacterium]RTY96146.1 NADH-quinone oxidoreductase subunit M [Flavobacterium sp. GSN2]RTY64369.1 NADH-quinone oxidoreductase subunit M [Flavobacterium sp. LB2P53]RTY92851.1 NADH-quinone oxidoreductase subunit M [Flavobacterium sp. RSP46]RTZ07808.1 NADH-quinone oxidoreductase subunit M [Flavobacterium bomense]RTZ11361.1 NADH-quinone oxidoreductase subunit M [Flavobacterium sp. GSP27]
MNVSLILIILLVGTFATYLAGDKLASKVALFFGLAAAGASIVLLNHYNLGENISFINQWITQPNISFALKADGLSMAMLLLTTVLTPIIIFSSFGNQYENSKSFYALILFMSFAMAGTFLASDGLLYYVFWELSLIPIYFIALIWGNGDVEERKKAVVKFFIYTLAGSLFMLVAFVYMYQKAGSLLLEDLYKLNLTATEQLWIFLAFFLAYAIKIPLIPFHTWQANVYQKAPTVGTMLLSGIMLKMGLYSVIRWQLPLTPLAAKEYMYIFIGLGLAGVIYGSIVALKQKDLKKLLAYSSLAHVGLIAAGTYTLTLDGLRGAVLQMIAHGFVVVGLFYVAEIIFRRYETRAIAEMGGIRSQTPKFTSMFLILVLASVALPTTFNFIGEFTVLYSLSQINIWFAILGGTTIILGAYYMLKMFQHAMLGETNSKPFADVTFNEGITLVLIIGVLFFFGMYPKPITDLITPSLEEILTQINRIN